MNQWGGTSVGVQLGEYNSGDPNNELNFVLAQSVTPKFSDAEKEYWYFLSFSNGNNTIQDNGAGNNATDGQLWKFVGTPTNFQLISKSGNYAYIKGTGNSARLSTRKNLGQTGGFSMTETSNSNYAPAWEIKDNSITATNAYFNQWQGAVKGHEIGLYALADPGNPITFISPDKMTYADYKVAGVSSFTPEHDLTLWYASHPHTSKQYLDGVFSSYWQRATGGQPFRWCCNR